MSEAYLPNNDGKNLENYAVLMLQNHLPFHGGVFRTRKGLGSS